MISKEIDRNKMNKIFSIILVLFCVNISSQSLDLNAPLPVNKEIKKGVLPNGLTYYIHKTDVTKDAASYYIIQNVGSILENENQQGLAHFLEHMAFNGTENFKGKGILNTLQKHGAVFGKDINAYTSFDETVYNINNIPTTQQLIDTCLLVLHDWSNYLSLTDEEIDAERGVIKEEWRTRQSGSLRVFQKTMPVLFNNTKYKDRMPIGKMEVVENFKYEALRNFYHDWYRTDLQAIAIIGDIDVDVIEQKIKDMFSSIPAVKNPKERYVLEIPENDKMLYALAMDKEVTTAKINFGIRHPKTLANRTVADLKEELLDNMIINMFAARIREISQKPDAPFLGARISYGSNTRSTKAFTANIAPKPNQQQEAFKQVLKEINRAVKFGFTQEEINRTIVQFKNFYETQISKKEDKSHGSIAATIQQNYLENVSLIDVADEYDLIKKLFSNLEKEEIRSRLQKLYTKKNRYLLITGVQGNNNLTENEALAIINEVENDAKLIAYADGFSGKTLISGIDIKKGKVVSKTVDKTVNATTFQLSNGVTVHYKFANKNKNDVKLRGLSYGGLSLISDEDLPSANFTSSVVQQSGLGDYSVTDLNKVLAGKTASTSISISSLSESISGSAVTKDVETMLQMVHLRFVKPRFDINAFKVFKEQVDNYIIRRSKDVNEIRKDSITVTLYGKKHPKQRLFNQDYANQIDFEKIKQIYLDRYKNVSDFEFYIVGDVTIDVLEPLLEKYIASIPTQNVKEQWKQYSDEWVSNQIDKDIYLKMEDPKSSVLIVFKKDYTYSLKNAYIAKTLADVLTLRYTETLREEEGGTYGASAFANVAKRPNQEAVIGVSFDCNPEKAEKLASIVYRELDKIANGDISQVDLDKTTTNYLKEREQQKNYNNYDMRLLINYYRENYDMNDASNFEEIIKSITVDDIKEFTKKVIKGAKSYEILVKPL